MCFAARPPGPKLIFQGRVHEPQPRAEGARKADKRLKTSYGSSKTGKMFEIQFFNEIDVFFSINSATFNVKPIIIKRILYIFYSHFLYMNAGILIGQIDVGFAFGFTFRACDVWDVVIIVAALIRN